VFARFTIMVATFAALLGIANTVDTPHDVCKWR
jgi:hypothetical protein